MSTEPSQDSVSDIWEFDVSTLIGPDTTRESFTIKIDFKVVDTKGFEGFDEKNTVTNVKVSENGRFRLSEVAGNPPVVFDFGESTGSVNITLKTLKSRNENNNPAIRVNVRANYSYTDLYKPNTGFQRAAPRDATFRLRLVFGNRDGHPPR